MKLGFDLDMGSGKVSWSFREVARYAGTMAEGFSYLLSKGASESVWMLHIPSPLLLLS